MPGSTAMALGLAAASLAAAAATEPAALRVPLAVRERAGVARVNEPVTSGVPLPDGAVRDPATLRLVDQDGREVPAEFRTATKWWHSDSVKWAHLTFAATVPANGSAAYTVVSAGSAAGKHALTGALQTPLAQTDGNRVAVDTGVLKFVVNGDRFNLLDGAWVDESGQRQYDAAHQVLAPGHAGGFRMVSSFFGLPRNKVYTSAAAPAEVEVLENGALRAVVKVSGRMTSADDLAGPKDPLAFECYLYAYRNWPALRVTYVFHVDSTRKLADYVPLDGISLDLPTAIRPSAKVIFGVPGGATETGLHEGDRAWLAVQDSTHARGGGNLALAEFAPKSSRPREVGYAALAGERVALTVGVKWFWQLAPKSLEVGGDGRVRVGLWPNVNDEVRHVPAGDEKALFSEKEPQRGNWYTGMSKTHEVLVGFGSRGAERAAAQRQWAWLAHRLMAEAPTAWYCQGSQVWGRLCDSTPALFDDEERAAVQRFDKQVRDWVQDVLVRQDNVYGQWDSYNIFNFGDHVNYVEKKYDVDRSTAPQIAIHWDNNYYGFPHALIVQWARTGDPAYLATAEAFSTHHGDIDTVWYAPGKVPGAARYSAGPMHIATEDETDTDNLFRVYRSYTFNHFKVQSQFERFYLFGDWQARDIGLRCEQFALDLGSDGVDWKQSRSVGHGLVALLAGYYATGEKRYLLTAKGMIDLMVRDYARGRRFLKGDFTLGVCFEGMREFWEQTGYEPAQALLEQMVTDAVAQNEVADNTLHAVAWLGAQKDDPSLRAKALARFKNAARFRSQWGQLMHFASSQRNTAYAVWYLARHLPVKDRPIRMSFDTPADSRPQ